MLQPTIEKLHALRLGAMANALTAQLQQPEIDAMPFAERLALLVDIQHSAMLSAALAQRLTRAGMRQSACMRIPMHRGHLFRFDRGQATDLMAATIPI